MYLNLPFDGAVPQLRRSQPLQTRKKQKPVVGETGPPSDAAETEAAAAVEHQAATDPGDRRNDAPPTGENRRQLECRR